MFRSGFARCPIDGTPLQELVSDPLEGSMFADRYIVEACVGEGGMGRVYRARHQRVSRRFAIKVLFGDHATDPKMRDRFAREAEAASRLDHPNVVSVVDFGETDAGLLYLVMDFVEGVELTDLVHREGPLEPARVVRLVRQLCRGLDHAHGKDLVHRDFKGENVIVTGTGDDEVVRIVDFGIAFLLEESEKRLTTEGMVLGTPAYMSPEQATGADLDHRTDLFSLGVLVYEMLAGVLPFEGPPLAVARQNLSSDPPAIAERVPGLVVAPVLEGIARTLMAKRREDRYQTAQEVIDALDAVDPARLAPRGEIVSVERASLGAANVGSAETALLEATTGAGEAEVDTEQTPAAEPVARRRVPWIVAALAAMVAVLAIGWQLTRGAGGEATRSQPAATVDAGDAVAATTPAPGDAGVALTETVAETSPPDAASEVPDEPRHATMAATPEKKAPEKKAPEKKTPEKKAPEKKAPEKKAITQVDLQRLYVSTGEAIERLARQRGDAVAEPYRAAYFRIPFADALRTASLRAEVDASLRSLRARVNRSLTRER